MQLPPITAGILNKCPPLMHVVLSFKTNISRRRSRPRHICPRDLEGAAGAWRQDSGARFLAIASQGFDLVAQDAGAALIASGKGDRQGELEFLQLVFAFHLVAGLEVAARGG